VEQETHQGQVNEYIFDKTIKDGEAENKNIRAENFRLKGENDTLVCEIKKSETATSNALSEVSRLEKELDVSRQELMREQQAAAQQHAYATARNMALAEDIAKLEATLGKTMTELADKSLALIEANNIIEQLSEEMGQQSQEIINLNSLLTQERDENRQKAAVIVELNATIADLNGTVELLQSTLHATNGAVKREEGEKKGLQMTVGALQRQVIVLESQMTQQVATHKQQLAQEKQSLERVRQDNIDKIAALAAVTKHQQDLFKETVKLKNEISVLEKQLVDTKDQARMQHERNSAYISELEASLKDASQHGLEIMRDLDQLRDAGVLLHQLTVLKDEHEAKCSKLEQCKDQLLIAQAEIAALKERCKKFK
jgi:chromosome segregation ATPase